MIKKILNKVKGIFKTKSRTLSNFGKKNKTDKINEHHSFAGKNYLDIYSLYLQPLRNDKLTMLEIGIRDGASLRTFRDYFKHGQIIGLDIDPQTYFKEERIKTYIGSQSSAKAIDEIFLNHPEIKIVLDDGSHINQLTLESFNLIFNRLPKGSFYIIEDLPGKYTQDLL